MKLIKPHKDFGNIMSIYKTIFKTHNYKLQVQEYYDPHYLEFYIWKRSPEYGLYTLIRWKKIPLNRYAYLVIKLGKVDSQAIKLKSQLDKLIEKRDLYGKTKNN